MIKKDKRGISPVIATVILISIVVVIGVIILMWALGVFSEKAQKFGSPASNACEDIDLSISYDPSSQIVDIVNNDPRIPLFKLTLNVENDGDLTPTTVDLGSGVAPGGSTSYDASGEIGSGTLVSVSPVLVGTYKNGDQVLVPCNKRTIELA